MRQLSFSRLWPKIVPYLGNLDVRCALEFGLFTENKNYLPGDPPWLEGRGPINGQRAKPGKLSWYQPWGRCHSIAPFAWAISKKLYPTLEWGLLTSDRHTVAVGLDNSEVDLVADILLFKRVTAEQSIEFVKAEPWSLCYSPGEMYGPIGVEAWKLFEKVIEAGQKKDEAAA